MNGTGLISIAPLQPADRERWRELWGEYQHFYGVQLSAEVTDATWQRIGDGRVRGLCARNAAGHVIGIVHFLFHEDTWSTMRACYLEDLYVDPSARGSGCGRLLIEAVAATSKQEGANSPYWLTHRSNATARRLYDQVAQDPGFMQYIYTAGAGAANVPD